MRTLVAPHRTLARSAGLATSPRHQPSSPRPASPPATRVVCPAPVATHPGSPGAMPLFARKQNQLEPAPAAATAKRRAPAPMFPTAHSGLTYVVAGKRAAVRAGFRPSSKKVAELKKGAQFECLQSKVSAAGQTRLRCSRGWVDLTDALAVQQSSTGASHRSHPGRLVTSLPQRQPANHPPPPPACGRGAGGRGPSMQVTRRHGHRAHPEDAAEPAQSLGRGRAQRLHCAGGGGHGASGRGRARRCGHSRHPE